MSKDNAPVEFHAGENKQFELSVVDQDEIGDPVLDVSIYQTASSGTLTVRISPDVDADLGVLELTEAGGGVTYPDAANGRLDFFLDDSDTEDLAAGLYHWQVRGTDAASQASMLASGRFDLRMLIAAPA